MSMVGNASLTISFDLDEVRFTPEDSLCSFMAAPQRTIGIIGAAISGPVFALQILSHPILRKRFKPIVFEQLGPPETVGTSSRGKLVHTAGAAVGLFPNGLFPLYELGLREDLHSISSEFSHLSIWRGSLDGRHHFCNTYINQGWDADLQTCPRAVERRRLRTFLLRRIQHLGGEIFWERKLHKVVSQDTGQIKVSFANSESAEVDMLVGSDGAWSTVRKYMLEQQMDASIAAKRWVPSFTGVAGIYGISSGLDITTVDGKLEAPLVLLDQGNIAYLPLKDGKVAWTMHIPEKDAPQRSTPVPVPQTAAAAGLYESKMVPGVYEASSTAEILRQHENIYHPTFGTWKRVFETSERILRSPLRLQVWETDEIQWRNIAVIGDAARTLPPYSGQGASMGIEDATVLADSLLNNLPSENDLGNFRPALQEYAQRRVPRSKKVARMALWSGAISMGQRWYWRWIRDISARLPVGGDPKRCVFTER